MTALGNVTQVWNCLIYGDTRSLLIPVLVSAARQLVMFHLYIFFSALCFRPLALRALLVLSQVNGTDSFAPGVPPVTRCDPQQCCRLRAERHHWSSNGAANPHRYSILALIQMFLLLLLMTLYCPCLALCPSFSFACWRNFQEGWRLRSRVVCL